MVEAEGVKPLNPVEVLRTMVALRDNNPSGTAKRFYALAKPRTVNGRVSRYILDKEAFTIDILFNELGVNRFTLYGVIREFLGWGLVHNSYDIDIGQSGARAKMYVLDGADPDKVAEAHKFHLELRTTSEGFVMESPTLQLVTPIVDDMMTFIMKIKDKSDWQVPLWEVKNRFRKSQGYVPADFDLVVNGLVKEKGWGLLVKGE